MKGGLLLIFLFYSLLEGEAAPIDESKKDWCLQVHPYPPCEGAPGRCTRNSDGSLGGFVAATATVPTTKNWKRQTINVPFIGLQAMVCDQAQVLGEEARVEGNAVIKGEAIVNEKARISWMGHLSGKAKVGGAAIIAYRNVDSEEIKGNKAEDFLSTLNLRPASRHLRNHHQSEFHEKFEQRSAEADRELKKNTPDQILQKIQSRHGKLISIEDPIEMEPFQKFEDLYNYLTNGKENPMTPDQLAEILRMVLRGLDTYKAEVPEVTKLGDGDIELDPQGILVGVDSPNLDEPMAKLGDPEHAELRSLIKILSTPDILQKIGYSDEGDVQFNDDHARKRRDMACLINEITEKEDFIPEAPGFGAYWNAYKERPASYKKEMLFKIKAVAKKALSMQLDDEQKAFVASTLMHAGRHCPDAKVSAIHDNLFPAYCPDTLQGLESYQYPKEDRYSQAYVILSQYKKNILEEIVEQGLKDLLEKEKKLMTQKDFKGPLPLGHRESASIRTATYDKLAPLLGLPKLGAPYPRLALSTVTLDDFNRAFSLKGLVELYKKQSIPHWRETLGPLAQFTTDGLYSYLAQAELLRFGILHKKEGPRPVVTLNGTIFIPLMPEFYPNLGKAWQDPLGLVWGDKVEQNKTWEEAKKYCADQGARLPTYAEYLRLMRFMKNKNSSYTPQLFSNITSTTWTANSLDGEANIFVGSSGLLAFGKKTKKYPVRCVIGAEKE